MLNAEVTFALVKEGKRDVRSIEEMGEWIRACLTLGAPATVHISDKGVAECRVLAAILSDETGSPSDVIVSSQPPVFATPTDEILGITDE